MITLRNHAPRSCMTWLRSRCWIRKFTVRFRPIRKEIVSWMYNNDTYYWVYLPSDHPFHVYNKVRRLILLKRATAFLLQSVTNVITMCDRYYKVRRLLQRATEQCSGSKDGKPTFHPYRYHLGLVKPQRLASLQKQKFTLCKVWGRLDTSRPLISSYRKWAKQVSMHEAAQRQSERRNLEVDLFRLNGFESSVYYYMRNFCNLIVLEQSDISA